MSRIEWIAKRFHSLAADCETLYIRWRARPDGTLAWPLAAKTAAAIMIALFVGVSAIVLGKTEILIAGFRIRILRFRIALLEATVRRDPYEAPRLGQALVCFFTPAKYRETAVIEMQLGYEFNVDRLGAPAARLAYWWEIVRNTYAFCGGHKALVGLGSLAGLALFAWEWLQA